MTLAATPVPPSPLNALIPRPAFVRGTGQTFALTPDSAIYVDPDTDEIAAVGQYLADKLNASTGYHIQVVPLESPALARVAAIESGTESATTSATLPATPPATQPAQTGAIILTAANADPTLGEEGYSLTVTPDTVSLIAYAPEGLFRGIQTIRQLLPPGIETADDSPIESPTQDATQEAIQSATPVQVARSGPWTIETGIIRDYPRFAWRGYMLDVARHFFGVSEIERTLDLMAYYKLNRFHLHLSDDQGWRIAIKDWPNLTAFGGSTQVGGGAGGYYTSEDYTAIVKYAQARYIMVVPEIDMPGHANAALASYPELTCDGTAPPPNTGTIAESGSLCVNKDTTYQFVDNVIKTLAALTPGPYIHIGGDESSATHPSDYVNFVNRVQGIVDSYGKQVIGWQDIAQATLLPNTIIQHWNWNARTVTLQGVKQGAMVIMSPVPLGERFAGYVSVQTGYQWEPAIQIAGLGESNILGVEAPLWTEIVSTRADLDRFTYPWLLAYAEIGWSPQAGRNWSEYRERLATHGPRLAALGVNFYRSADVPWQP